MSINIWVALALLLVALMIEWAYLQLQHKREIEMVRKRRLDSSRASLRGQAAERLLPMMEDFPYLPSDARFLGDPVDYVVFSGYADLRDKVGEPEDLELVILDVKRGRHAHLSNTQKAIARAIEAKRVRFEVHRVMEDGRVEVYEWRGGKLRIRKTASRGDKPKSSRLFSKFGGRSTPKDAARVQSENPPSRSGLPWDSREVAYLERKIRQGASYESLAATVRRTPEEIRAYFEKRGKGSGG